MFVSLLVIDQHGELGGGQRVLVELVAEAVGKGWRVVVAAPSGPLHLLIATAGGMSVVVRWPEVANGPRSLRSQVALLAWNVRLAILLVRQLHGPFNIIVSNGPRTNAAAVFLGWIYRAPVVWYLHRVLTRRFERTLFRLAFDVVRVRMLSVSRAGLDALGLSLGRRVRVVPNGVHSPDPVARHSWPDLPVVASVGRLDPQKGHSIFLMACRELKSQGIRFQPRIVGDPILWSSRYFDALETECHDASVTLQRLDGQPVPYSDFDIVVVASTLPEACPLVVLEAMAYGCAVIASDVGGIPELIEHGTDGLLVPANSIDGLARGIRMALENPDATLALVSGARRRVQAEFSVEVTVRRAMLALDSWRRLDTRAS